MSPPFDEIELIRLLEAERVARGEVIEAYEMYRRIRRPSRDRAGDRVVHRPPVSKGSGWAGSTRCSRPPAKRRVPTATTASATPPRPRLFPAAHPAADLATAVHPVTSSSTETARHVASLHDDLVPGR